MLAPRRGVATMSYSNSFVAELTPAQVARLQLAEGVLSITPNRLHKPVDDRNSVDFLGLSGSDGVWSKLGGCAGQRRQGRRRRRDRRRNLARKPLLRRPAARHAAAAAPDRPAVPARHTTVMRKSDGGTFSGVRARGGFHRASCNAKIISARYFGELVDSSPSDDRPTTSRPATAGHGAHTAGTAAGNAGVPVTGRTAISGQYSASHRGVDRRLQGALEGGRAPRQRRDTSDIGQAIDSAVTDGVDVINYSVGGTLVRAPRRTRLRWLSCPAASAGVFCRRSAGNTGPAASTMDNTQPWVTTVAASTVAPVPGERRAGQRSDYRAPAHRPDDARPGRSGRRPRQRRPPRPPSKRGTAYARRPPDEGGRQDHRLRPRGVDGVARKSAEVARRRRRYDSRRPDQQDRRGPARVPTMHITHRGRGRQATHHPKRASPCCRAAQSDGSLPDRRPSGFLVAACPRNRRGHSRAGHRRSRRQNPGGGGPAGYDGKDFDSYSGTSMAAPHIAGLAALVHDQATALVADDHQVRDDDHRLRHRDRNRRAEHRRLHPGRRATSNPTRMLNPGLVLRHVTAGVAGLPGRAGPPTGSGVAPIQGSDLNYPSIGVGRLSGGKTITRTVTAVTPGVYTAKVDLPGFKTKVSPSTLRFTEAGQSRTFTLTMEDQVGPAGRQRTDDRFADLEGGRRHGAQPDRGDPAESWTRRFR